MALDTPRRSFRIVGTRPPRPDGIEKVTGRALYGADAVAPGMLHGAILRSPHAHARILGIDASAALAMPNGSSGRCCRAIRIVPRRAAGWR